MKYNAHITDTLSGETRVYASKDDDWAGPVDEYYWSDGNYGCDCNRGIFFHHAGSPELSAHEAYMSAESECGEGRYFVRIVARDGGQVLFEDQ